MATTQLQLRRGNKAQNDAFAGAEGEVTVDIESMNLRVHKGDETLGGTIIPKKSDVVSTTGDIAETVTGKKTFTHEMIVQNNGISLVKTGFVKGTAPSSTVYWGIRANDSTNSATWANTRIGTLEWAIQNNSVVSATLGAIKNEAGSTNSSNLTLVYDTANSKSWATCPKPDNDTTTNNNRIPTTSWVNQTNEGASRNNLVHITGAETISGKKTYSDTIVSSKTTATYLAGNQGAAIINSTASAGAYTMLAKMNTTNGYMTFGTYGQECNLYYTAKTVVDAQTNGVTKTLKLLDENGNSTFPGSITIATNPGNYTTYASTDAAYKKAATAGWANTPTAGVNNIVHKSGDETVGGIKTFSSKIVASGGVEGTATRALWADLAENYIPDEKYPVGTLIKFGGERDITIADDECNGIISEQPGFLLDSALAESLPVALVGKTNVRVLGKVKRFDKLVLSETPGIAKVKTNENEKVIAIALDASDNEKEKLVRSVVKIEF